MKKFFFSLLFFLFVISTFSQNLKIPTQSKEFYLKKSKNQKTSANIFGIAGTALIITALVYPKGEELPPSFCFYGCAKYKNSNTKSTIGGIGFLSLIPAIPLYLASSKNKRKAERAVTIKFNNRNILLPQQGSFVYKSQPGLTLNLNL